jgi:hypothetical protein
MGVATDNSQGAHADRAGAISHMKGTARLLHMCGPESFQRQPLLNAFEATRSTLLVAFLVSRQRLFLESEQWRTVPWALDPSSKTPQSEVLDVMMSIPGILQDHAEAESAAQQDPGMYEAILDKLQTQLIALYEWRWRWQADYGDQVSVDRDTTSQPNGRAANILGSIGRTRELDRLRFSRFEAATEIMLYNAALMWLLTLCWKLAPLTAGSLIEYCSEAAAPSPQSSPGCFHSKISSPASSKQTVFDPLRRPGAAVTVRDPAVEICRAFEWLTRHHGMSREQTCLYLFPVGMAMSVLEKESAGREWIKRLLGQSDVTSNYGKGDNVAGFGFYLSAEALDTESVGAMERVYNAREMTAVGC